MFDEPERRSAEIARHKENKGRLAHAFARYRTTGLGSMQFPKRVDFGLIFIEQPFMAYGTYIDTDALDDLALDNGAQQGQAVPHSTGFVTEWEQNDRGYYTGAWVGALVAFPGLPYDDVPPETQVEVVHYFQFSAIGIKAFPDDD